MQKDDPIWQCPPEQSFEQHSPSVVHVFPELLQAAVMATHLLAVHVPPQHSAFVVQARPSETHCLLAHLLPTQLRLQQSVADPQVAPAAAHAWVLDAHVLVALSQIFEQQSAPDAQTLPNLWQVGGEMMGPKPSASMAASPGAVPPLPTEASSPP
jgi:hypothetical protein